MNGVLVVDKPEGVTSFDVLNRVKRMVGAKKAGHTGILDAFAGGVLPVFFEEATKLIPYIQDGSRTYEALVTLGIETDTLDQKGDILAHADIPAVDKRSIEEVLRSFCGETWQVPPKFCAKKIHGKRASDLARKGVEIELNPVKVFIRAIELLDVSLPNLTIRVYCHRGTYIRSLARDIGRKIGTLAMLKSLVRTQCGPFVLSEAASPSAMGLEGSSALQDRVLPIETFARRLFPDVMVTPRGARRFFQGERVAFEDVDLSNLDGVRVEKEGMVSVFESHRRLRLIGVGQAVVPLERNARLWPGLGVLQPSRVIFMS
ncbi:MAG: tRNA pseudouridine(55) synthase TruB [Nitrospirota bacterium]|nr:tRNA pseudouridine(55) synthase TruB [Nitrospirota bacterium]